LYPLSGLDGKAMALTAAVIIMSVLLAANVTVTNAQQQQGQQQLLTSQPITSQVTQNGTIDTPTLFESTVDSFRVQLPEDWVIQDVNNTGFTLAAEVQEGYGVLAQLCPKGEEGQQQGALTNDDSSSSSTRSRCPEQAQEETIFIIRYPNLGNRLGITVDDFNDGIIPDSIAEYQIQKLQEVGYQDINIVNSSYTTINLHYISTEGVPFPEVFVPARLVEVTYSTSSAPSEMKRGYLVLTATNVTPPSQETITGYGIFYEHASGAAAGMAAENTTTVSGNLIPSAAFIQVFDSFELIVSEEAGQVILDGTTQQAAGSESNDQEGEEEGEEGTQQQQQQGGEEEEGEEEGEEGTQQQQQQGGEEEEGEEGTQQTGIEDSITEEAVRGTPLEGFFDD
jgi:hypothetical protein